MEKFPNEFWIVTVSTGDGGVSLKFFDNEGDAQVFVAAEQDAPWGEPFDSMLKKINLQHINWNPVHQYDPSEH